MKSFEDIAEIWLQSELFGKQYSYRKGLEKDVEYLIKYFGSRNCEEIKGMDVDQFIQYETEHGNPNTGKPFSKRLMKAHLSAGLNIYEYALENELIDCRNPFNRKKKKIPKSAPVEERTPIDDEQKEMVLRVYHRAQIAAVIMLYCGLRRGEIIPLRWSDIDLINKKIAVTKSVERVDSNNFRVKGHTKNGKDRYITIPDNIIPLLKLEKYQSKGNKLIFTQKCGKMHTVGSWQSTWESYQKSLNYEYYCQQMRKLGRVPKHYNAPTGIPQLLQTFSPHQLNVSES
ncbi:MAG: site-specific integrase [Ruminococcus sp.]|nr:site-specific integrase [Ruminococcus sp.]